MRLEFTNATALVLLLAVPIFLLIARHSQASLGPVRRRVSILSRITIIVVVTLALAGLRIRMTSRDVAMMLVVDVSASIAPASRQVAIDFINREIEQASSRDYVGVIAFGREPSVELAPTRKEVLGDLKFATLSSSPAADYTDIAAALRLAAALVPDDAGGRVVLISDGGENLESALAEAGLLRARGIEVSSVEAETNSARGQLAEVAVSDLSAPEKLAEGEAFDLRVTINSTRDTDAKLRVFRNESVVAEREVHLTAAGDNVFSIQQRADQRGFFTFRATIEAIGADTFSQNNTREAFSIVEGRPGVLYAYGDQAPSQGVLRVLSEGSFDADVRNAGGIPTTLAAFQNYDLVIFDNVAAASLTNSQMKMVQTYVRELGGGFVMIGGEQSFGPGGYYKTPIEEVLPVSLDVRQKKHLPSLALVLVIDKSGSMSGQKMQLTQEAAAATVSFLSERDSVGVIAFDDSPHTIVNLAKAENKDAITRDVRSIQAFGGTNMYPGLKTAHDWLSASDAQIKHVIVLSDGVSEGGDFRGIARAIREAGMTLTSIAVGDDADHQTMKFIADTGGGRFYATNSPETLPRIFAREASLASRSTIIEEPFTPRLVRPTQATQGIDWNAAPQLSGYVGTAERDDLKSPGITSLISDKDDPVYAVWQYGLGRAAAFTSDAKPRWAAGWMTWPGFGQFWTQVFRDTLRTQNAGALEPKVEINAGRGHIVVEAQTPDGTFANEMRPAAHVIGPDLKSVDVQLEQTAAGRYEGDFEATALGSYMVRVADEPSASSAVSGAVNSYSPEFNIATADEDLLAKLSQETGGQLITSASEVPNLFERKQVRSRPREIWQILLLAALLLLPFDVGIRRVHLTREQLVYAGDWLRSRLRGAEEAPAGVAPSLGQLKQARVRVRLGGTENTERVSFSQESQPGSNASRNEADESKPGDLASRLLEAKRKRDARD